jgi:hypothetical protein
MLNDPPDVRYVNLYYHLTDSLLSVSDFTSIAAILFDTVVVVVTLVSTVGTWRIYKRSIWDKLSLTHLLAQQSKPSPPLHHISHLRTSLLGLLRLGYVIRIYHS